MKKSFFKICLLSVVIMSTSYRASSQAAASASTKVIIIRHGEKPDKGDNLSCQGLNRALQLPQVLFSKFGVPSYIFVPSVNNGKTTNNARMFQTITPFAAKYNLNVDTKFDVKETDQVAEEVMKKQGTILLVWEHKAILKIAKALGVKTPNLKWDDNDFDSIWIITLHNGTATLTTDKEHINPGPKCP